MKSHLSQRRKEWNKPFNKIRINANNILGKEIIKKLKSKTNEKITFNLKHIKDKKLKDFVVLQLLEPFVELEKISKKGIKEDENGEKINV